MNGCVSVGPRGRGEGGRGEGRRKRRRNGVRCVSPFAVATLSLVRDTAAWLALLFGDFSRKGCAVHCCALTLKSIYCLGERLKRDAERLFRFVFGFCLLFFFQSGTTGSLCFIDTVVEESFGHP